MMTTEKVSGTSTAKPSSNHMKGWNTPIVLLSMFIGYLVYRNATYAKDPIMYMIPNFLMFTPFLETTTAIWKMMIKYPDEPIEPQQIPEIQAKDFSMERMREATNNWRSPAVVRGLFANTTATKRWGEPGYLKSIIGQYQIPVVTNTSWDKGQQNRSMTPIGEAWDEILANELSRTYMFFPVKSRYQVVNHTQTLLDEELVDKVNKLVRGDLDFDRIWKGFGSETHKTFVGSQMIAGRGMKQAKETTGTGFHCAVGNNWFIQVVGKKQWYFVDQYNSAWMIPRRGGLYNMVTGAKETMQKNMDYLPLKTTDVSAGDLLYNPDWMWHAIRNYEGLSIGCPIREKNLTLSMQNNFQYTSMILINHFLNKLLGVQYGMSAAG